MKTTSRARRRRAQDQTYHPAKAAVKLTTIVLFGTDAESQESARKLRAAGQRVELVARESFDTGKGQCGKHLCHCKGSCLKDLAPNVYAGDQGPTMGMGY